MSASEKNWLPTSRVEALSDGIFAIIMTILVLDLAVPDAPVTNADAALRAFLAEDWPKLLIYFKGFLLLGVFWVIHHKQFYAIRRTDGAFIWINIIFLMLVALAPFTTSLEGEYGNLSLASFIFDANIFAVGLVSMLLWFYATRNRRLVSGEEFTPQRIRISRYRSMVVPGCALLAMGLSLVIPVWSSLAYLMIPLILKRL